MAIVSEPLRRRRCEGGAGVPEKALLETCAIPCNIHKPEAGQREYLSIPEEDEISFKMNEERWEAGWFQRETAKGGKIRFS